MPASSTTTTTRSPRARSTEVRGAPPARRPAPPLEAAPARGPDRAPPTTAVRTHGAHRGGAVASAARRLARTVGSCLHVAWIVLRVAPGAALALTGLAVTGGSFGMFAFIGVPLLAIGFGLMSASLPTAPRR